MHCECSFKIYAEYNHKFVKAADRGARRRPTDTVTIARSSSFGAALDPFPQAKAI